MTSISPASSAAAASSTQSGIASAKLAENFDNFLKLLTTQLQYQDPLNPMDNNQFTQQLVSFTGVEQSIATNKNLESLIQATQANNFSSSLAYLGREVNIGGGTQFLANAQGGEGLAWNLDLSAASETTKISIVNQSNAVVWQGEGPTTAGSHQVAWDGLDRNGRPVPPGRYTLKVEAKTFSGQNVANDISFTGTVSSLEAAGGSTLLTVNGTTVDSSAVRRLSLPTPPQDAASAPTNSTTTK
jgi:flagellar basal-body rod modification protein FlgD